MTGVASFPVIDDLLDEMGGVLQDALGENVRVTIHSVGPRIKNKTCQYDVEVRLALRGFMPVGLDENVTIAGTADALRVLFDRIEATFKPAVDDATAAFRGALKERS